MGAVLNSTAQGYIPDHQYNLQSDAELNLLNRESVGFELDSLAAINF